MLFRFWCNHASTSVLVSTQKSAFYNMFSSYHIIIICCPAKTVLNILAEILKLIKNIFILGSNLLAIEHFYEFEIAITPALNVSIVGHELSTIVFHFSLIIASVLPKTTTAAKDSTSRLHGYKYI